MGASQIHSTHGKRGFPLTFNRHKISITLEELGLSYNVRKLEFSKNQQKEPWFLEINRMCLFHSIRRRSKEVSCD